MNSVNNEGIIKSISLLQNELKNIASNKINLCNKDIFKDFYINRGFEEDFHSKIKNYDDILLTGRAGSGKSTLIKKVLAEDEEYCNSEKFCVVLINCETEKRINSSKNIFLEIEKYIYHDIFDRYIGVNSYNNKKSFAKKILQESLSLSSYRHDEAQELINIYTNYTQNDLNKENFDQFFEDVSSLDPFKNYYNNFLKSIFEKKEEYLPSLLYYLNETRKINFFFIFDNVDSLPHSQQIETYKELLHFKNNVLPCIQRENKDIKIKTIISLRDENYRSRNGAGVLRIEHFNIMNQTRDSLVSKTNDMEAGKALIFKVLSNKISYLMKHRVQEDSAHNIRVLDVPSLGAIASLLEEWSKTTYIIGDIFKYSNYSIRHAMYNILDFLLWLIKDLELTFNVLRNKKILEINSLYIAWIASEKKIIQKIEGLDLVQLEKNVKDNQYTSIGCDISILVLNFIKNKNKVASGLPRVKFSELVHEFADFVDKQTLKQLIYDMYMLSNEVTQAEEYGHIIYMPLHDDTFKIDDIKDDTLLALYPRAEELLFLSQTFTFISIIYESKLRTTAKEYFELYNDKLTNRYINNHYLFLEKLVKVHMIELYRIYDKWKDKVSSDENWYTGYLEKFSLDQKFQIEHIVELTVAFLDKFGRKYQNNIDSLNNLRKYYLNDIKNIPNNIMNNKYIYTANKQEVDIEKYIRL